MKVTPQIMAKFENCKSAEEIMDLAKSYNVVINKKQAQDAFELLKSEDISDQAMEKVTGGWDWGLDCSTNLTYL